MAKGDYCPVFPNTEVALSDRDCYNCLFAYYEGGDPQSASCLMYDEKPLKVQCAEEHCPDRLWNFAQADEETLRWVLEYEEHAKRYHCGYDGQIKGTDEIRRILEP